MGKLMTISHGATMRDFSLETVVKALKDNGLAIVCNHPKFDEPSSTILICTDIVT